MYPCVERTWRGETHNDDMLIPQDTTNTRTRTIGHHCQTAFLELHCIHCDTQPDPPPPRPAASQYISKPGAREKDGKDSAVKQSTTMPLTHRPRIARKPLVIPLPPPSAAPAPALLPNTKQKHTPPLHLAALLVSTLVAALAYLLRAAEVLAQLAVGLVLVQKPKAPGGGAHGGAVVVGAKRPAAAVTARAAGVAAGAKPVQLVQVTTAKKDVGLFGALGRHVRRHA